MIRIAMLAAAISLAGACAGEASAQGWTHEGLAFPGRDNWCSKATRQDDGQGGTTPALELRPCGKDFPFMSLGVGARGLERLDLVALTAEATTTTAGAVGEAVTTDIFKKQDPGCTKISREVVQSPVEGVSGFDLIAKYNCPAMSATPTVMRNFTAYAQRKNGDVWVVAFDHPDGDISEADKAMIRTAVATIQAN